MNPAKLVIPCPQPGCDAKFEHSFDSIQLPPLSEFQDVIEEILDAHFEKAHDEIKESINSSLL